MKRLFALILAVSMLLSMASVGFADGGTTTCTHSNEKYVACENGKDHNVYCADTNCGQFLRTEACTWNTDNKCTATGCGNKKPCEHTGASLKGNGKGAHGLYCETCKKYVGEMSACSFGDWVMEPDNPNTGEGYKECSVCKDKLNCDHAAGYVLTPANKNPNDRHAYYCKTCKAIKNGTEGDGWDYHKPNCKGECTVCGKTGLTAGDHVYESDVHFDAAVNGHYANCSVCGEPYGTFPHDDWEKNTWVDKDNAVLKEGDVVKADLKTNGDKHWFVCRECGGKFWEADHDFGTTVEQVDGDKVNHKKTCLYCGYVKYEAHTWAGTATCKDGTYCTACGYSLAPLGHKYEYKSNATQHWQKCSVCGNETAKEAHILSATWNEDGTKSCTVCKVVVETEHEHNFVEVPEVPATCHKNGTTAYRKCVNGSCTYEVGKKTITKLHESGEAYVYTQVKPATCTEAGQFQRKCKYYDETKKVCANCTASQCKNCAPTIVTGAFDANGKFVESNDARGHKWVAETVAADCNNNEYTVYTCSCGEKKVEVKTDSRLGHKLVAKEKWVEGTVDKCEYKKVKYYECFRCGYNSVDGTEKCHRAEYPAGKETNIYQATTNPGTEVLESKVGTHKYGTATTVNKGCVNGTWKVEVCQNCGYKKETKVSNGTGAHAPANERTLVGKRATCFEEGLYYYVCNVCDVKLDATGAEVTEPVKESKKTHDWQMKGAYKEPTCSAYGYVEYTCKNCKTTVKFVFDGIASEEEKMAGLKDVVEAYVSGSLEGSVESDIFEYVKENKEGHKFVATELLTGSDKCGETGWYKAICEYCGNQDVDNIKKVNEHTWVLNGTPDVAPSCKGGVDKNSENGTAGKGKIICSKCGKEDYSNDLSALLGLHNKHNIVTTTLAADCTHNGRKGEMCSICGAEWGMEDIKVNGVVAYPALGHKLSETVLTDCTLNGAVLHSCSRCDYNYIDGNYNTTLSHGETKKVWKNGEPTCTKGGEYTLVCTKCGRYTNVETVTVTEKGVTKTYKTNTPKWTSAEALGHSYDPEKHIVVAATCVNEGYTSEYCKTCGETIISNKVAMIKNPTEGIVGGHKDWKVVDWKIEGNCYTEGVGLYGCPYCGKTAKDYNGNYVTIAAGHHFPAATQENLKNVLVAPTCDKNGLGTVVCELCGVADKTLHTIYATGKHNFGTETVKSTDCSKPDVTYYYCMDCHQAKAGYLYLTSTNLPDYGTDFYVNKSAVVSLGAVGEHKFGTTIQKREATCTEEGGNYVVCSKCGATKMIGVTTAKLPHEEKTKIVTEATCYMTGLKVTYCLRCGNVLENETIAKKGHNLVVDKDRSVAANCISKGYTVSVCKNDGCTYEITEAGTAIAPANHVYETTLVDGTADCVTKTNGVEKQVCKYHKDAIRYKTVKYDDVHEWTDTEVTKEATCLNDGTKNVVCSKCGATKKGVTIKAAGHKWATRNVEATCLKGAYVETYCSVCGVVAAEKADVTSMPLGHVWQEKVYVQPSCTKDGYWSTVCARCDEEKVELDKSEAAKALGHDMKFVEKTEATCKDPAYNVTKCSRCDHSEKTAVGIADQTKHKYVPVDETVKVPACTENGVFVYSVCSVCGVHTYQLLKSECEMIGPFVAKNGNTVTAIYNVCKNCGKIEILTEVNGFDGFDGCMTKQGDAWVGSHTLAGGKTTEATCEEAGKITKLYCTKCGTVLADEVELEAKGHTEVKVEAVPATCTKDGTSEWSYCSVCEKVLVEKETIKAGHKLVEVEAAVEATCTTDGKTATKKCENCEYTEGGEVVNAKGHVEEILPAVDATESKPGLTEGKKCSVCGKILVAQTEVAQKAAKLIVPAILRAAGYDKATALTRVYKNTEVKILEAANENNYYKVEALGQTGYMHKSYIEIL